jgi:small-conductance mechanosensitive channel
MSQRFKIDSVWNVLTTNKEETILATRREIQRTVTPSKAFPGILSLVGGVAEFVLGIFAVFYLLAPISFAAAVLFFTFCQ